MNVRFAEPLSPSVTLRSLIETVGSGSSSVRLIVAEFTIRPADVPLTVIVSSVSVRRVVRRRQREGFVLAHRPPAAISMLKSDTAAKSTAVAVPLPATLTLTVVASANCVVPFTVAFTVIVVAPSFSATLLSFTDSVNRGRRPVVVRQADRVRVHRQAA